MQSDRSRLAAYERLSFLDQHLTQRGTNNAKTLLQQLTDWVPSILKMLWYFLVPQKFSISLSQLSHEVCRATETFGSAHHQFWPHWHSLDSGQASSQKRWLGSKTCVFTASHKEKYVDLGACYIFVVETLGIFNASACHLLDDLGRRNSLNSGEARTDQLPVPEDLGIGAALQCCPIARQFASRWRHGLMIVPTFSFLLNF